MTTTAPDLAAHLRSLVRGTVLTPGDPGYEDARRVEAGAVDVHPLAIVRVADARDVQAVVPAVGRAGVPLAVRGGGHSSAGHGTVEAGVVLDLAALTDLHVDVASRTARAGAGLSAGAYVRATAEHGLTTGFGDTAGVGIAGLTLGGGIGLLSRRYGLTVDALLSVEVVTADGQLRVADADHEPDLFWALRGGGGNFGVVTSMSFRLEQVAEVTGGLLVLPATAEVLSGFLDESARASRDLTTIATVMPCPPLPFVDAAHHGTPVILGTVLHLGSPQEAGADLAPLRALAEPLADLVRTVPYAELLDWEGVPPTVFASRTTFLERLDPATAGRVVAAVGDGPGPVRLAQFRVLGGAIAEVAADATAYGFRDRAVATYLVCVTEGPDGLPAASDWADGLLEALDQGDHTAYVNFLGSGGPVSAQDAYPPATWERLRRVKAAYDPDNLFRRNHNIPPAEG